MGVEQTTLIYALIIQYQIYAHLHQRIVYARNPLEHGKNNIKNWKKIIRKYKSTFTQLEDAFVIFERVLICLVVNRS